MQPGGGTLPFYAISLDGSSVATVRTHLAILLAKTGTARQSDLIRLLSRLPFFGELARLVFGHALGLREPPVETICVLPSRLTRRGEP